MHPPGTRTGSVYTTDRRNLPGQRVPTQIQAQMQFDDECKNGHKTFYITGNTYEFLHGVWRGAGGGCIHEEIATTFPELAHLIQWHGCHEDGPLHYPSNVLFHAGDRDCWGLRKGERRQIINGRTGEPAWELRADATGCELTTPLKEDEDVTSLPLHRFRSSADGACPSKAPELFWAPWYKIGEGKLRELDAARRCAIWPEATDEELLSEDLEERLQQRLPALLTTFKTLMQEIFP